MRRMIPAVLFLVLTSACSHYETGLRPEPVSGEFLPLVTASEAVAVIPEYPNEPVKYQFFKFGPHKWYVNTHEVVDASVKVAKDILRQNKVRLDNEAKKALKISFVNASCDGGVTWTLQLAFRIGVQAGQGAVMHFEGTQHIPSDHVMRWGIEAAISYATIKIFQDPTILAYLKK